MTKDELIVALYRIAVANEDREQGHIYADKLLLEYIDDAEVTEAYRAIDKWYG